MKLSDSQYPLKKVFYRMFSLLVVVLLIVVFAAAAVILYQVMRTSAVDTISAFQETVATTLNTDIKSASLQLSHFVYVNDGEFLDVANRVYSSSGSSQQYLAAKELERSFNTAMVPSQNILAGLFFMKGGGTVPVKESTTLPDDALRAEGWYRTALDNPNRVTIGGYDTSKTDLTANAQKGGQLVLVTAMAPNYTTDRSGRIEMVAYFTTSQVSEVPLRSRSDPGMGTTLLLNEEGQPSIVERARVLPPECRMAAADAATLEAIGVAQAHLVEKYGEAIDRESAYEKLAAEKSAAAEADALAAERAQLEKERAEFEKQKAAEADRAAKAAAKEEERVAKAAEREAERAQKTAEKEAERAARAAEKQREQAMKTVSSVIGQIGRETSRQLLRGLFGNLRK